MKKLVGVYQLGFRNVELYVKSDYNGGQVMLAEGKGLTEVIIGIEEPSADTLSTLLHEAYECVLIDLNTRYKKAPSFSFDTSDFIFHMTHNELSEAHERVANFLVDCLPDFQKEYEKYHKSKSKRPMK